VISPQPPKFPTTVGAFFLAVLARITAVGPRSAVQAVVGVGSGLSSSPRASCAAAVPVSSVVPANFGVPTWYRHIRIAVIPSGRRRPVLVLGSAIVGGVLGQAKALGAAGGNSAPGLAAGGAAPAADVGNG